MLECDVGQANDILYKLKKNTFSPIILKQHYFVLIYPLLLYGIIIWGSTFSTYLYRLKILQNKALKVVVGFHDHDLAKPIFANLQILQYPNYLFQIFYEKKLSRNEH